MTLDQALAFGLIAGTAACFPWGRLPFDLIAAAALMVGVLIGMVPAARAFEGVSDEVVVVVEAVMRPITPLCV